MRKLAIWLGRGLAAGLLLLLVAPLFEGLFFFKSSARKKLEEHNMQLLGDFRILSNDSGGLMDYTHQFSLAISEADHRRIIAEMQSAENFKGEVDQMFDIRKGLQQYRDQDTTFRFHYSDKYGFGYQCYKTNGKGYAPIWDIISISKDNLNLTYLRIVD